ncbi:MAG: DUF6276 family protein [Haloarculaceae archaeon]
MECPDCDAEALPFPVPADLRAAVPGEEPGAAICTRCLALHPVADPPADPPDFQRVSQAMPRDPDAGLPLALGLGLLRNLALHRAEIADLFDKVERAGSDPLLVLDRLAADGEIDTDLDLEGRRRQLEQLL